MTNRTAIRAHRRAALGFRPVECLFTLYTLLLSLYSALLIVSREAFAEGSALLRRLNVVLRWLDWIPLHATHQTFVFQDGRRLLLGQWYLLAVFMFSCMLTLRKVAFVREVLYRVMWLIGIVGPWYCRFFMTPDQYEATAPWLWYEMAAIVAVAMLFLYRTSMMDVKLSIAAFMLHYGIWGAVLWGSDAWGEHFWNAVKYLLLPFGVTISWSLYVSVIERTGRSTMRSTQEKQNS